MNLTSKRIIVYAAIFNVAMIVAFVFSNLYVWNYLNTEINERAGNQGQGNFVIPYVFSINGFEVVIGHDYWSNNGTIVNLGTVPTGIPNYPFIIFWVTIAGNLVLIALVFRKQVKEKHKENTPPQPAC